jgi:hypothetical protein
LGYLVLVSARALARAGSYLAHAGSYLAGARSHLSRAESYGHATAVATYVIAADGTWTSLNTT